MEPETPTKPAPTHAAAPQVSSASTHKNTKPPQRRELVKVLCQQSETRRSGSFICRPENNLEPDTELHRDVRRAVAVGRVVVRHKKIVGVDSVYRHALALRVGDVNITGFGV